MSNTNPFKESMQNTIQAMHSAAFPQLPRYAIQSTIDQEYLQDIGNALASKNDGFTNWNSSVKDILSFPTKEEAQAVIDHYNWAACEVVPMPDKLLADFT